MSDKKKNEIDQFLFDCSGDISARTRLQSDLTEIETMLEDIEEPDLEPREKHLQNIIRKLAEEVRATEGVDAAPTVTPWQGRFDDDGEEPFGAEWKARLKEAEENWEDLFPTRDQEMERLKEEIAEQKNLAEKGRAAEKEVRKRNEINWAGHEDRRGWLLNSIEIRIKSNDIPAGMDHVDLLNAALDKDKERNPLAYVDRDKGAKGRPLGKADMNARIKELLRKHGRSDLIRIGAKKKKS